MIFRSIISFLILLFLSLPAVSAEFIVGAKAGYYSWIPFLKEMDASGFSDIDQGSGILYGPVISLIPTADLSLSFAALTGVQSTHWNVNYELYQFDSEDKYVTGTYYFESKRTDVDSALSYRLNENFKAFLGFKYQDIESKIDYTELRTASSDPTSFSELNIQHISVKIRSWGPALGFGYSLPFGRSFFLAANLSGLYMKGYVDMDVAWFYNYNDALLFTDRTSTDQGFGKHDIIQKGLNFEPSIGFRSEETGLIFTLGFRYQWLRIDIEDTDFKGKDDYLYGCFVSVLFAF